MVQRPTIIQVAKEAGVSPSTVSRAFNEPRLLRPATVERVRAVAERLGYLPNRHARALITGRSGAIGLIVPDIANPFFPRLIRFTQRSAEELGLSVFVLESDSVRARERAHIASLLPQTEGLIVASSRLPASELVRVAEETRLVLINQDYARISRVLLSSRDALTAGIAGVAADGARHLCYVGGPGRSWSQLERSGSVRAAATAHGLQLTEVGVDSGTYAEAEQVFDRAAGDGADVVIAFDDVIAHAVLNVLRTRGIAVPGQVRVLGCDDALPIQTSPRLSTIPLPVAEGAQHAVQLLTDRQTSLSGSIRVELQGTLELRETT